MKRRDFRHHMWQMWCMVGLAHHNYRTIMVTHGKQIQAGRWKGSIIESLKSPKRLEWFYKILIIWSDLCLLAVHKKSLKGSAIRWDVDPICKKKNSSLQMNECTLVSECNHCNHSCRRLNSVRSSDFPWIFHYNSASQISALQILLSIAPIVGIKILDAIF